VSPAFALIAGIGVALAAGNPFLSVTRRATRLLLAASLVGLGAGMDLRAIAAVGVRGIGDTVSSILFCLGVGALLAKLLGVRRDTAILTTVGTAICGGSAIAAMVPVLRPSENETSVALGTVFLLNALALVCFPIVGHFFHLGPAQFGLWSALAIHDTSSVVGAALQFGPKALEVATTVKLTRALWIVPLTLLVGAWHNRRNGSASHGQASRPWFILGFLAAAAIVTFIPALRPAGHVLAVGARQLLIVTLFLIGTNLTPKAVRDVGARPLLHGALLWLAVAATSLGAILIHLVV
jgi:uncharacterized integral membrane protein (TIGR00698 family)